MMDLITLKEKTKTLNVLYVEDDLDSMEQVSSLLEILFKSVQIALDGLEAWNFYEKQKFDLIITDINMPKVDGIELAEKIKSIDQSQKIVIVSAHDSGSYILSAIRCGVDDFILKPVEIEQFERVICKIVTAIHNEHLQKFYQQELESEVENKTQELVKQAVRDDLTSLYNRKKLTMDLEKIGHKVLVLLNIDNFDNINSAYGYNNGDLILQKIAIFLKKSIHPSATLYRVGHDEFAFLFTDNSMAEVESYAYELQALIRQEPIIHENITVKFTATIVLAEGNDELLKNAHIGFNETRLIGKNRVGIYRPTLGFQQHQEHIQNCLHELSSALQEDRIIPYFQPIINNKTNQVEKYECLARLLNNGEIKSPGHFMETAELSGMLSDLTRVMIDKSFEYFENRTEEFSINISEHDLNDGYLNDYLEEKILKYGIDPKRVVLEVLEGISANGAEKSLNQLYSFKKRGFQLAIDDFGAQNSNFERVHHLEVDYIKIDGSFIKNIKSGNNSYNVSKTITDFSKSIGAKVIAEFVHSKEVLDCVLDLDIDYSQGYYFSEPVPVVDGKERIDGK